MEHIKTVNKTTTITVDSETGEVLDTQTKEVQLVVNPDDFCLIYSELWNVILRNPLKKCDVELFAYLVQNYSDGTPFNITEYTKEQVSLKSGSSRTSYNNSTRNLLKHNLIYVVNGRTYKINPRYAFKGSSKDRHQAVINMMSNCKDC